MFKSLALFILIAISPKIYATSQLLPGYIITQNGDSVFCKIEYGDWHKNPQKIRVEVNNEKKTLGVTDIKGFGVVGYGDYRTTIVSYHLNPIDGTELPDKFSDSTVTKELFLKVLSKGVYLLYELETTERKYFFIQRKDSAISELVYRVAAKEGEIKEDKQFVGILANFFLREDILDHYRQKVYNASYSSTILTLVNILNETHTGKKTENTAVGHFRLAIFAGGAINMFPSTLTGGFPDEGKLKSPLSAVGGINLLYIVPQRFQSLKFGLSLLYNHYHSSGGNRTDSTGDRADLNNYSFTTYTTNLSLTNTIISANLYATYTINPLDKIKFYIKAGLSVGSGKKDVYAIDDYNAKVVGNRSGTDISGSRQGSEKLNSISTFMFNPLVGAGIETGRHRLEFSYYHPWDAGEDQTTVFRVGMTAIYYYFTILK